MIQRRFLIGAIGRLRRRHEACIAQPDERVVAIDRLGQHGHVARSHDRNATRLGVEGSLRVALSQYDPILAGGDIGMHQREFLVHTVAIVIVPVILAFEQGDAHEGLVIRVHIGQEVEDLLQAVHIFRPDIAALARDHVRDHIGGARRIGAQAERIIELKRDQHPAKEDQGAHHPFDRGRACLIAAKPRERSAPWFEFEKAHDQLPPPACDAEAVIAGSFTKAVVVTSPY